MDPNKLAEMTPEAMRERIVDLTAELIELRKDKARLDWLATSDCDLYPVKRWDGRRAAVVPGGSSYLAHESLDLRAAIDSAMHK